MIRLGVAAGAAVLLTAGAASAQSQVALDAAAFAPQWENDTGWDEGWGVAVTPYLYGPAIKFDVRFERPDLPVGDREPFIQVGSEGDAFDSLDAAFMGTLEVTNGRWGALVDVVYADLSLDAQLREITGPGGQVEFPFEAAATFDIKAWVTTFGLTGRLGQPGGRGAVQGFLGARYLSADLETNWTLDGPLDLLPQSGTVSADEDIWDGVAGVKGRWPLDSDQHWNLTYYVDVGAGDSRLTWQAIAGVAYSWNWGDLRLAWRELEYERSHDEVVRDIDLRGPAIGATFRF